MGLVGDKYMYYLAWKLILTLKVSSKIAVDENLNIWIFFIIIITSITF